jgi:hypothetical protein
MVINKITLNTRIELLNINLQKISQVFCLKYDIQGR